MSPPFPPPLGSSLVLVSMLTSFWCTDVGMDMLSPGCISAGLCLLLPDWLLGFGAKIESLAGIGCQFWRENNFQTRAMIGPWKITVIFGGKIIFKQGPWLALGKLVLP